METLSNIGRVALILALGAGLFGCEKNVDLGIKSARELQLVEYRIDQGIYPNTLIRTLKFKGSDNNIYHVSDRKKTGQNVEDELRDGFLEDEENPDKDGFFDYLSVEKPLRISQKRYYSEQLTDRCKKAFNDAYLGELERRKSINEEL